MKMNRFLRLAVLCLCLIMACQSVAFAAADKLDDDSKTVKSIEVKELPSKVEYFTKEEFNLEGGVILVTYEDGSTAELSMTSSQLEVNKPNTSKTGSKNVGIKYRGKKTSFKISVAAKGLTVTFRLGSGAEDIQKNVTKGAAVKAAEAPAWEGHTFQGWYADEACTLLYDFDTAIENDTEIYAFWTDDSETYCTVCFDMNYYGCVKAQYPQKTRRRSCAIRRCWSKSAWSCRFASQDIIRESNEFTRLRSRPEVFLAGCYRNTIIFS